MFYLFMMGIIKIKNFEVNKSVFNVLFFMKEKGYIYKYIYICLCVIIFLKIFNLVRAVVFGENRGGERRGGRYSFRCIV